MWLVDIIALIKLTYHCGFLSSFLMGDSKEGRSNHTSNNIKVTSRQFRRQLITRSRDLKSAKMGNKYKEQTPINDNKLVIGKECHKKTGVGSERVKHYLLIDIK